MTSREDNRFYREPQMADQELRYDEDGLHIYWLDPVEGCWVAFRRVDCVGEEELPERRLPRTTFGHTHTPGSSEPGDIAGAAGMRPDEARSLLAEFEYQVHPLDAAPWHPHFDALDDRKEQS